ncbi:putative cytochrome P450 monooxygenase [Dothidotthia symphoricarpi CBS 119687]|uniref:Putative cytochrome P450 monooxygenase n=1 Tax=Dothidotthia symphoricarpi CBS 119687 TaxID=1392245 RepID=A0A6A6AFB3_9PLEO|nr:putative cytochrome P450 monooxygenase [Dothidotthia symphoricarpi CBS 119687]KAF2129634.1 putative cytochrome P450 monooxygenase [Dothidotthia symphoricarpi CBS 119687]
MQFAEWLSKLSPSSVLLSVSIVYVLFRLLRIGHREHGLPPGPKTLSILGNIHQFPQQFPQLKFVEWMKEFGEIFTIKLFNSNMIIISSPAAIKDILDTRGALTGGRPKSHMQRAAQGLHFVLEGTENPVWKRGRKAITRFLTTDNLNLYMATQKVEYVQMLNDVLTKPDDIYNHIRRTSASVMTSLVYGKKCLTFQNSSAEEYFEGIKLFNETNDPGAYPPIELLPWLKHTPRWLAPWTEHIERTTRVRNTLYYGLLAELEEKRKVNKAEPCYMNYVLDNVEKLGMSYDEVVFLGAVLMDAGGETASSYLQSFVLAMLNFPDAQKKAQKEIDAVIGNDRLPCFTDYDSLPYLRALVDEVHRFRPILPIGLPRIATQDLVYKDYVLPKGSMLVLNAWGLFHDPELFDTPDVFRPERYLDSKYGTKSGVNTEALRDNIAFGAGRRICPGEEMGRRTIAMNTMNLLWAFKLTPKQGESSTMDMDSYSPGLEMAPKPFSCNIVPRVEARAELIRAEFESLAKLDS